MLEPWTHSCDISLLSSFSEAAQATLLESNRSAIAFELACFPYLESSQVCRISPFTSFWILFKCHILKIDLKITI